MRSYTTHERKGSSRASEPAIVYTAPYFAKENYTRLDKFSFFRNEDADLSPVGSLSVLPTATVDATRLAITNNASVTETVLQNAANFFANALSITYPSIGSPFSYKSLDFGNGVWVAVASGSNIAATSPDGITWTQRTLPVSANWMKVRFGNNGWVAIAENSSIAATSSDGITWTQRTLPVSANWQDLAFANGIFVLTRTASTSLYTSSNGQTWTSRNLGNNRSWATIVYGVDMFIVFAYASNYTATSSDGVTWTQRQNMPVSGDWVTAANGFGGVIAILKDSDIGAKTSNGITWSQIKLPLSMNWRTISFGDDIFFLAGHGTTASTSPDGITWTLRTVENLVYTDARFYNGKFIVIGSDQLSVNIIKSLTNRITETPALTLPANHSYFVKIT